jgi:general secretion pathway protein G
MKRTMTAVARAGERGMTLVEIMVVVVIMAVIATGVSIYVIPKITEARVDAAKTDLSSVRTAIELYQVRHPGDCPNGPVDDALGDRLGLKRSQRHKDPWDNEYIIKCEEGAEADVYSRGPDGQDGTDDDVR